MRDNPSYIDVALHAIHLQNSMVLCLEATPGSDKKTA